LGKGTSGAVSRWEDKECWGYSNRCQNVRK